MGRTRSSRGYRRARRGVLSLEQIKSTMSALGLNTEGLSDAIDVRLPIVERFVMGTLDPSKRSSRKLVRLYHLPKVQVSLPGFQRIVVVPPASNSRRSQE